MLTCYVDGHYKPVYSDVLFSQGTHRVAVHRLGLPALAPRRAQPLSLFCKL